MSEKSNSSWQHPFHKILDKDWYYDTNTVRVFFHLLLKANSLSNKWQGIEIKRGSLITSRSKLANETNLSEREIRTSLSHLQGTNEVTIKTTNRYTHITICKYEEYMLCKNSSDQQNDQQSDQQVTSKVTNKRPAKRPTKIIQKPTVDEAYSDVKKNNDQQNDQQTTSQSTTINNNILYNTFSNEKVSEPKGSLPLNAREEVVEEVLEENTPKKSKGKNKSPTIVSNARKIFEDTYLALYDTPYYWTAKDAANMKQLLQKITYAREHREKPLPTDEDSLLEALSKFLNSINKSWIADNYSVAVINSQYNAIRAEMINKSKQNNNGRTESNRGSSPSYEERQREMSQFILDTINSEEEETDVSGNY